jgi:hypothetical protein
MSIIHQSHEIAAERDGRCLSDTCRTTNSIVWLECKQGHRWEAVANAVANGSWCPSCAGNAKGTIEGMHELAHERDGKCLSSTYINSQTKLLWECCEGHRWESTPNKVKSGRWCPTCFNKTRGDFRKLTIEEMNQIAADRDGRCLSEAYTNNRTKLLWECREGHTWEAAPAGIKKGTWCPKCCVSPLTRRK